MLRGGARTGKTRAACMMLTNPDPLSFHPTEYIPTLGAEVHPLILRTTNGKVYHINLWDCAGDPRFGGLGEGYDQSSHGCMWFGEPERRATRNTPVVCVKSNESSRVRLMEHLQAIMRVITRDHTLTFVV